MIQRSPDVILRPASFNEPIKVPMRISTNTGLEQCTYNPEFTTEQVNLMQNVVRTRMPPPAFEPVTVGPLIDTDMSRVAHPILDNLCLMLKAMGPSTMASYQSKNVQTISTGGATQPVKTKISYFINPQYLTKDFCNQVIESFKTLPVVTNASYLLERHLNEHVMYRLTIEYLNAHFGETPPASFVPPPASVPASASVEVAYHFQKPTNIVATPGRALSVMI